MYAEPIAGGCRHLRPRMVCRCTANESHRQIHHDLAERPVHHGWQLDLRTRDQSLQLDCDRNRFSPNEFIPWVIVGMHKPCLSLGEYACEPGTDIFNLLLDKKVDLVLTGHEHLYQRTHQLAKSAGCASIVPGTSVVSGCIADNDSNFAKGAGTIFATVGTGGINLRDVSASDPEAGYFAASSGLNSNATWGSLNVVATSTTLNANFSRASGGTFTDSFRIDPPVAQPNVPPVARITKSCQGLTCTIDGRTSSDSDGSIVSYAWQLGDGATDSRDNFSHSYAKSGHLQYFADSH